MTNKKSINKKSDNVPLIPRLESDEEEVKNGTGIKELTLNKLLTRIPVLLDETIARNGSCKFKNEIRQIAYLLFQHNKTFKMLYND